MRIENCTPEQWKQIGERLLACRSTLVTTHVHPDGDGLGAGLGLVRFLKSQGAQAKLLAVGDIPSNYRWMDDRGEIEIYDTKRHDEEIRDADGIVVLDMSTWERLGDLEKPVRGSGAWKLNIDHHPPQTNPADTDVVNLGACAVGEMIFQLIEALGKPVDRGIAEPLYVSLLTDTGSFRFSNTDREAHRIAGELIATGIEPSEVYNHVYECYSIERLHFYGRVLQHLQVDCDGRLAWCRVSHKEMEEAGIRPDELDGLIDLIRWLNEVEVAVVFKELEPGKVKVSLRSQREVDVNRLARKFGGGGHVRAAGATGNESIVEFETKVIDACREALMEYSSVGP